MCNPRGEEWYLIDATKTGTPWVNDLVSENDRHRVVENTKFSDENYGVKDPRGKVPCEGDATVIRLKTHGMVETSTCLDSKVPKQTIPHTVKQKADKATPLRLRSGSTFHKHTNVIIQKRIQQPPLTWILRRRRAQRAARRVCCTLCGVTKYTPPQWKKLAPVNRKNFVCVGDEDYQGLSRLSGAQRKPRRLIIWLRKYPKVKLCDIGNVFEISRHFSCLVPPAFFTFAQRTGVHCFKRQVLAFMCQELLGDGSSFEQAAGADEQTTDARHTCADNGCQRVRVFVRRNRYLCSRTYLTWPFKANAPPPYVRSPAHSPSRGSCASPHSPSRHTCASPHSPYREDCASPWSPYRDGCVPLRSPSTDASAFPCSPSRDTSGSPCSPSRHASVSPHSPCRDVCASTCSPSRDVCEPSRSPSRDVCASTCSPSRDVCEPSRSPSRDVCEPSRSPSRDVCEPSRSPSRDACVSSDKPYVTPQESSQDVENAELVPGREAEEEHIDVVPSLEMESEEPPATQDCPLIHKPVIFHQSYYDLTVSGSARQGEVSNPVLPPSFKNLLYRLPARREPSSPAAEHGQDSSSGEPWTIGDTVANNQSTTCSSLDLSEEESPRDEGSENNEEVVDMAADAISDSTDAVCYTPDPTLSQSDSASAVVPDAATTTSEFQVHEQDAIVLDVIDDDPDLFGCIMTEMKDEPNRTQLSVQRTVNGFTESTTFTKKPLSSISDTKRCVQEPAVTTVVKVKNNNLQCSEEIVDVVPSNQMTTQESSIPTSPQSMDTSMSQEGWEDGNGGDGYSEDWSSDCNSERTLACNLMQEAFSTERFTLLKGGGPSRPPINVSFCMVMVEKFAVSNNPVYVKQAVDVFTRYYETCAPGLCFNVQPPSEFLLAVFQAACTKQQQNAIPKLIYLLSKGVEAGCLFSMDQCEHLQRCLEILKASKLHMDLFLAVKCRALANVCDSSPDMVNIAYAFVDVELCRKQEDWKRMADIFLRMCASPCTSSHLLRFCVAVATALLVEPTQSPVPPYVSFAEEVSSQVLEEGLDRSFLGRIGISVMVHYYTEKQWSKGQKVVEVLSRQQPCYSGMKGVFRTEDETSRCRLITMATELPLHCGSVEIALNVLRDNNWFVSDSSWPCGPKDVAHRVAVQTRLAQCTSSRDTLEVLTHLPGLLPPLDLGKAREYTCLFNSLIRSCLERHTLLVGADTLEYLLANGLQAELSMVQNLICELGKRNQWHRGRILFQCAMKEGYYPLVDVAATTAVLELPSYLNEVEMAICLEMFISRSLANSTQNPNTLYAPVVVLKRASESGVVSESVYLSAGCSLLSSAQLLNPKLRLSYTSVNAQQQQVYTIDPGSAHKWLHCNSSWAHKLWPV
ncbi:hypothetical protein ACEWY4_024218 [Coilia grayii]|uniref:Protein TOPAZ1 n=1 Tax=Coilia grayii TaxID=363190 RepID=A0ABD1J1P1_9TELE